MHNLEAVKTFENLYKDSGHAYSVSQRCTRKHVGMNSKFYLIFSYIKKSANWIKYVILTSQENISYVVRDYDMKCLMVNIKQIEIRCENCSTGHF